MTEAKIKENATRAITDLRKRAARHGIFSLAELARRARGLLLSVSYRRRPCWSRR
jgi:hypothetical protein